MTTSKAIKNSELLVQDVTGTVKWFNVTKGYGFIINPEYQIDIYVHFADIVMDGFKALHESQNVVFDLYQSQDGKLQATHVRIQPSTR